MRIRIAETNIAHRTGLSMVLVDRGSEGRAETEAPARRRRGRRAALGAVVAVVLAAVFLVVGIFGPAGGGSSKPVSNKAAGPVSPGSATLPSAVDPVAKDIGTQQTRLKTVPGDWTAWAGLAADYVQEARITADPTYYPKADGAVAKSFQIQPHDNFLALTVKATIAAARHDFTGALALADQSLAIDSYSAVTYGVRGDALDELGRYPEALAAFEKMDHLRPTLASYSRLSYAYELRGNLPVARRDLQLALGISASPSDSAYAAYYLGELAWGSGDLSAAERYYRQGVSLDPDYVPPLEGVAKVEAARGQTAAAIRDYGQVVDRLPQPAYVIEFGDYLASIGRTKQAQQEYGLVLTEEKLFQSQGVNVDLELSLFQADHGDPKGALASASAEYGRRHSTLVEDAYGWALHVNGNDRDALAHANAALAIGTRSALFYYHRGTIEAALGLKALARKDLQEALTLNPNFSPLQAPHTRAALEKLGTT
jgi:tetratricopeptide (TPR) repeat protein